MDIDTEGMDFELLKALDTSRFPFKMICTEVWADENRDELDRMLMNKGYVHFMDTWKIPFIS